MKLDIDTQDTIELVRERYIARLKKRRRNIQDGLIVNRRSRPSPNSDVGRLLRILDALLTKRG
jgi:hypothetical protein